MWRHFTLSINNLINLRIAFPHTHRDPRHIQDIQASFHIRFAPSDQLTDCQPASWSTQSLSRQPSVISWQQLHGHWILIPFHSCNALLPTGDENQCKIRQKFIPLIGASRRFMAALYSRCGHYILQLWLLTYLLTFFFSHLFSAVGDWMATIHPHMMWP